MYAGAEGKWLRHSQPQPLQSEDLREENDLAAKHPEVVKDLAARVDRWRALYPPDGIIDPKKDATPDHPAPKQWAEAVLP